MHQRAFYKLSANRYQFYCTKTSHWNKNITKKMLRGNYDLTMDYLSMNQIFFFKTTKNKLHNKNAVIQRHTCYHLDWHSPKEWIPKDSLSHMKTQVFLPYDQLIATSTGRLPLLSYFRTGNCIIWVSQIRNWFPRRGPDYVKTSRD